MKTIDSFIYATLLSAVALFVVLATGWLVIDQKPSLLIAYIALTHFTYSLLEDSK